MLIHSTANQSIFALYKGATPPAVAWAVIDSVLLGSLHNYRLFLTRHGMTETVPESGTQRLTIAGHTVAGLFAGLTSAFLATPMEHLKVKLQMQSQSQGVPGLWTGFTGSLAFRSNFAWLFGSYEVFMRGFSRLQGTAYEARSFSSPEIIYRAGVHLSD
ncbi:hypothetical protein EVJ58_g2160 [Rhodofomes roseus]|uniref:Uncharacterized protein n=1 Tax=Rhodofomes roseus TaxID=34475 RepID=A0A4Y9YTW2_9APHY|nr:hypothetical protein EVJ58_g2160 [Rhodofomes roseus]